MRIKKRITIIIVMTLFVMITIFALPSGDLKTKDMMLYVSDDFAVYFEPQDEKAAKDIIMTLETKLDSVQRSLRYEKTGKTEIYIYPEQSVFHKKKYGLLGSMFAPEWYVGDHIKDKVIMTSPLSKGLVHSYESMLKIAVHEYVHTVNYQINPKLPLWINEGIAMYLAGQRQTTDLSLTDIPSPDEIATRNPLTFAAIGGYELAYTYIEFFDQFFGRDKLGQLVRQPDDFEKLLGYCQEEVYYMWVSYLEHSYFHPEEVLL